MSVVKTIVLGLVMVKTVLAGRMPLGLLATMTVTVMRFVDVLPIKVVLVAAVPLSELVMLTRTQYRQLGEFEEPGLVNSLPCSSKYLLVLWTSLQLAT